MANEPKKKINLSKRTIKWEWQDPQDKNQKAKEEREDDRERRS